jgi:predicted house-cleaning noncanonical NTP pyrophosphatase (MazG superfamily)
VKGKLVRDKIPDLIRASGQTPIIRTAAAGERMAYLRAKLFEEVEEFRDATYEDDQIEEIADVFEVVLALAWEIGHERVAEVMADKHERNGGFDEYVVWEGNE